MGLTLPDKPSIAVLPFQNMSGDPEQDYFADGMVEDIVTGLSRIKWLFVIARNSSFVYRGKAVDVRQVGRELGVRYVLEGAVRKAGSRVRITAQLVEAETGAHLWADKFDGGVDDVFELQDQITDRVVGIVEPSVRKSEIERSRRKHPENLDAYDLYLRALPHFTALSTANAPIAAGFLRGVLALDPDHAGAHAHLAWCHQILFTDHGFDEADKTVGLEHARTAIAKDVDDATALAVGALVIALLGHDARAALNAIERAASLNPSSSAAHYHGAFLYAWSGDPATATAYAHRALRLSPFDPLAYHAHLALTLAAIQEDRYDEAVAHGVKLAQVSPNFGSHLIALAESLALAGRLEEARPICARAQEFDPTRIRTISEIGFAREIADKLVQAHRLLGIPE
jgi:TolB-like protein/tetratricopeptide (TPR) repeat protein